jgi:hypothetical protein
MPLLTKSNLELAKLASDTTSRFTLNAIHITPTEVCVTDGHILATLETSSQSCESWPSAGLRFKSACESVRIEAASPDGQKFLALLMPAKSDDISGLDSTPEIVRRAKSGKPDAIVEAGERLELLRKQVAALEEVLA